MPYGLKKEVKEGGRITTIIKPKIEIRNDFSGYGKAKDTPYYMTINNKIHRRFKTKESALKYYSTYKRKMNATAKKMLN